MYLVAEAAANLSKDSVTPGTSASLQEWKARMDGLAPSTANVPSRLCEERVADLSSLR
ncbi:MAG: hypothetical protein JWQ42_3160 [Edaphobacter sp.]|jgi:hypothetical protein|nr:hypothetical protein [Edaphobacter sp.]